MTDPVKVEIVSPVITNTENPWRTQGDYREDQRRQIQLHKFQAITLIVAVVGLVVSSGFQLWAALQPPQKVEVQCISQPPSEKASQSQGSGQQQKSTEMPSKRSQRKEMHKAQQ